MKTKEIKEIRLKLMLSQKEFAKKIGVTTGMVIKYEAELHPPRQPRIIRALYKLKKQADKVDNA